jgi:hypothetical protein
VTRRPSRLRGLIVSSRLPTSTSSHPASNVLRSRATSASVTLRPKTAGSDFAALNRQIVNAGLLERRAAYYAVRLSVVTAIYAGSWVLFFLIGSSWWNIAVAGLLGLVFSQAALLAHDVAHRQMFRTKKPSA